MVYVLAYNESLIYGERYWPAKYSNEKGEDILLSERGLYFGKGAFITVQSQNIHTSALLHY
jgi:hypothetical protein